MERKRTLMGWTGTWTPLSRGVVLAACVLSLGGCASYTVNIGVSPRAVPFKKDALRVAVTPFLFDRADKEIFAETIVVRPKNAGDIVADAVGDIASKLGYQVVSRHQFQALLRSHGWTASDLSKPRTRAEIGRALNIFAVIGGKVKELASWDYAGYRWGHRVVFNAGLVRLDTGEVVWAIRCEEEIGRRRAELLPPLCDMALWRLRRAGAAAVEEPRWWNIFGLLKRKIYPAPPPPALDSPPAPQTPPESPPAPKTAPKK